MTRQIRGWHYYLSIEEQWGVSEMVPVSLIAKWTSPLCLLQHKSIKEEYCLFKLTSSIHILNQCDTKNLNEKLAVLNI
jgi:hypothetical protein